MCFKENVFKFEQQEVKKWSSTILFTTSMDEKKVNWYLFHMILFADKIRLKQAAGHKGVLDLHTLVLHVHTSDHALQKPASSGKWLNSWCKCNHVISTSEVLAIALQ